MAQRLDVIVVGAGHNGLVCAAYLAKAGLDVLVLEKSHRIGGACITEELVPGFHFSTFAYSAHGPGPKICRDLEIPEEAFTIVEYDPASFMPFPDGDYAIQWLDHIKTAEGLERFGPREADGYIVYQEFLRTAIGICEDLFLVPPLSQQELYHKYDGKPQQPVLEAMLGQSHWDVLCQFFDSEKVRCLLARADDVGYPSAIGSLLAEVMECASSGLGVQNQGGLVRGGMGMVTAALADAAKRYGTRIQTESGVDQILVENGTVVGVRLVDGQRFDSRLVISNADPKRTFLKLVDPNDLDSNFCRQVENLKTRAGYMKYHAILSELPRFTATPNKEIVDPNSITSVRIAPSLAYYEQAWLDAQNGIPSRNPVLSLQIPTAYCPEAAQEGKHIFGAWIRYAPARPKNGSWKQLHQETLDNVTRVIGDYCPNFLECIEWQRLYSPADIEQETGITNASIRHLDMTLDQMLTKRPLAPWSSYKAPIPGLYLCGSGTHPCGSVTGAPGHNAAQAVLQEIGKQ